MTRIALMAPVILLAGTVSMARASTIVYDGGAPDQYAFYVGDQSDPFSIAAELLRLPPGATTISEAHWWGACFSGPCPEGDFVISFHTHHDGEPGSLLTSYSVGNANQTSTGNFIGEDPFLYPEYAYSAAFAPITLMNRGSTLFWFAISNTTVGNRWGWETADTAIPGGGHKQFRTTFPPAPMPGIGWLGEDHDLAFQLTADATAVPEPTTLLLMGIGLLAVADRRRRTRRSTPNNRTAVRSTGHRVYTVRK